MKYQNQIAIIANTVTVLSTTTIVEKETNQYVTDIQNVKNMTYTIYLTVPSECLIEVFPKEEIVEYNKYRERLHSLNIKNKIKWNRIRSNPNTKKGRIK